MWGVALFLTLYFFNSLSPLLKILYLVCFIMQSAAYCVLRHAEYGNFEAKTAKNIKFSIYF